METALFQEVQPNPNGGFDSLYVLDRSMSSRIAPLPDGIGKAEDLPDTAFEAGDDAVTLRIFHFNDLHHHLLNPNKTRGDTHTFSQMVQIVEEAKTQCRRERDRALPLGWG